MPYSREIPVAVLLGGAFDAATLAEIVSFMSPHRLYDAVVAPTVLAAGTVDILAVFHDIRAYSSNPADDWPRMALCDDVANCVAQIGIGSPTALMRLRRLMFQGPWPSALDHKRIVILKGWVYNKIYLAARVAKRPDGIEEDLKMISQAWAE
jgi:hypothetical protein